MPTYAWESGVLIVRVFANSMTADGLVTVRLIATAPTECDPANDFEGPEFASVVTESSSNPGEAYFANLSAPLPPYADLVVEQRLDTGALEPFGAITLSADVIVRGRFFDRVSPEGSPPTVRQ